MQGRTTRRGIKIKNEIVEDYIAEDNIAQNSIYIFELCSGMYVLFLCPADYCEFWFGRLQLGGFQFSDFCVHVV